MELGFVDTVRFDNYLIGSVEENWNVELGFVDTVRFDNYLIGSVGKLDRGTGFC